MVAIAKHFRADRDSSLAFGMTNTAPDDPITRFF